MKFYAKVKKVNDRNLLSMENHGKYLDYLTNLKEGEYVVDIKKKQLSRTTNQNKLYWLWLRIIGSDLGYDEEELHDSFKAMFLTDKTREIPLVRSTTQLSIEDFTNYLSKIQRAMADLGISLPSTEEEYYD